MVRRLPAALLLCIALSLAGVLAVAGSQGERSFGQIATSVAAIHPGDEGEYVSSRGAIRFRFAAEPSLSSDGTTGQALVLLQDGGPKSSGAFKFWIEGDQVLAAMRKTGAGTSGFSAFAGTKSVTSAAEYQLFETTYRSEERPFCGLVNSLQGRPGIDGSRLDSHGCGTGLERLPPGETDAPEMVQYGSDHVQLTLDANLPVPRAVTLEGVEWRLGRFSRGDLPEPASSEEHAHPIQYQASELPIEAGIRHRFPLSQALAFALESQPDNSLKEFMRNSPSSYVAAAGMRELVESGQRRLVWTITASDGADAATVNVTLFAPQVDQTFTGSPMLTAAPVPTVSEAKTPRGPYPHSGAPKPGLALLDSLSERWEAMTPKRDGASFNAWGFSLDCGETCDEARSTTWIGIDLVRELTSMERATCQIACNGMRVILERNILTVDDRGLSTTHAHSEWWFTDAAHVDQTTIVLQHGHSTAGLEASSGGTGSTGVYPRLVPAAALTLLGILAATAYYMWPGLKSLILVRLRAAPALLANPIRDELRALIALNPGIHFHELRRRTGRAAGTLRHHLRVLENLGQLVYSHRAGYKCYFPARGRDRHVMGTAGALKAPSARIMLKAIVAAGHLSMGDAAGSAGLTPSTGTHHALRLEIAGLVTRARVGRTIELRPTLLASTVVASSA